MEIIEIRENPANAQLDELTPWPISWSAVWVGALSALAAITVIGLYGTAIGVGSVAGIHDFSTWQEVKLVDLIAAICGAFFAYVIGGWVAGKVSGARLSEPAILHGAIAWVTSVPILLAALALGLGKTFGGWYGSIAGSINSGAVTTVALSPAAIKHSATAAATALLVGLIGSVIGGWMASGEPMSITHHKTRAQSARSAR